MSNDMEKNTTQMPGRYMFAGGGTGGHIYMAVAIREELKRRDPGCQVLFVGTIEGLESKILPPLGFSLRTIRVGALNKVSVGRVLKTLMQLPSSLMESRRILRDFRPTVVISLGGYSAGPVVMAAKIMGCPSVLVEPNAYPGLTNRLLGPLVRRAAVAFKETGDFFPGKARKTGIPIRTEFHQIPPWASKGKSMRLLVFGGSRGSRPINRLMCDALSYLRGLDISVVHQTGGSDLDWVSDAYKRAPVSGRVKEYIEDMPSEFESADIIISRSGASTVAEISAAGRASILIPFPTAANNHQWKNALALQRSGAAILVKQSTLSGRILAQKIIDLVGEPCKIDRMAKASRAFAHTDSAVRMADLLEEVQRDD
jgi:UDP-N-acetylglucosamine--N-acetylmuramyl-(pentapeptide) pyrophosphoryl-undecaprenol N-acetylglucosamine transferase